MCGIAFPSRRWRPIFRAGGGAWSRWLRSQNYDLIILAYAKEKRLCFASAFSGTRRRIAMWGGIWGRLTFHHCLRSEILTDPRPFSQILLRCAEAVGAPGQGLIPDFFLRESEQSEARASISAAVAGRRLIGIHPGSAGNACNLPSKVYGELAAKILRETDCALILTGMPNEAKLFEAWPTEVLNSERVWNAVGQLNIRQLAAVVAEMAVYVCPSTGPLHVASAVGIRTVSPFCPKVPLNAVIWGNVGAPSQVVEPATCPRRSGKETCCDFHGQISANLLFSHLLIALAK